MARYEITFDPVRDSCGQLDVIKKALEECSDSLYQLSRNAQEGLERESEKMAQWSTFARERADDVHKSSVCLESAVENMFDAEKLTYERLLNTGITQGGEDSGSKGSGSGSGSGGGRGKDTNFDGRGGGETDTGTGVGDGVSNRPVHGGDLGHGLGFAGIIGGAAIDRDRDGIYVWPPLGPFMPWDNRPNKWPDWAHWPALQDWRLVLPILMPIMLIDRHGLRDIWKLLRDFFNKGRGGKDASGGADDQSGGASGSDGSSDVETGRGVSIISADEFADAEAGVNADMGSAESLTYTLLDDSDESPIESILDETVEPLSDILEEVLDGTPDSTPDFIPADMLDEIPADKLAQASSGASRGSGGSSRSSSVEFKQGDTVVPEVMAGATVASAGEMASSYIPVDDKITTEEPIKAKMEERVSASSGAGGGGGSSAASLPLVTSAMEKAKGGGAAAPIIGAASLASIAASGLGIGSSIRGQKGGDGGDGDLVDPPVIATKEGAGVFSGNLKGEYYILASAISLVFAGASITAGVRSNRNGDKPNDRFRIGYGTSAVLSGGAIQERS